MLNKYNQLSKMLEDKYSVSRFDDDSIVEEFFMVDNNSDNINYISIFVVNEKFEIIIEVQDDEGDYIEIEKKYYKNVKSAYNYIIKMLEE